MGPSCPTIILPSVCLVCCGLENTSQNFLVEGGKARGRGRVELICRRKEEGRVKIHSSGFAIIFTLSPITTHTVGRLECFCPNSRLSSSLLSPATEKGWVDFGAWAALAGVGGITQFATHTPFRIMLLAIKLVLSLVVPFSSGTGKTDRKAAQLMYFL